MNNQEAVGGVAGLRIRKGTAEDVEILARFNLAMAEETEEKILNLPTVLAGVRGLVHDPSKGFYLLAELDSEVAGSLMITTEWSDWRDGDFWWIQSVYVEPGMRRRKEVEALGGVVDETTDPSKGFYL
ncbi:MAG: GNAT family N-acetyltransferase, partial [Planctomycetota bacterium]